MPDKRSFEDMNTNNENKEEKPSKKRKLTKFNRDDFLDLLRSKAQNLNQIYLKLLEYTHTQKRYIQYENKYRNEEMDIVILLKREMYFPEMMNRGKIGLNHTFAILPLDKVNKADLESDIDDIDEDDDLLNKEEEYDSEEDTDYNPLEEAKRMVEEVFSVMKEEEKKHSYENLIKNSKLSVEEQDKMTIELNKIKELRKSHIPDTLKILQMNIPIEVKSEILEKMELLDKSPQDDVKTRDWIRQVMKIPFGKYSASPIKDKTNKKEVSKFLTDFHSTLDKAIYGQTQVKETLIEIITKWATSTSNKGNCIAINGPPGTGKTSIIREGLAKALNRPFCSFSLAGVSDENYLTGFPFTYEGATCGRFAKMIMDTGCMNPIIFIG